MTVSKQDCQYYEQPPPQQPAPRHKGFSVAWCRSWGTAYTN